jgi:hypothetical protein
MSKTSIVTARCNYARANYRGRRIRIGSEFVVAGKYPGVYRPWLGAQCTGEGALLEDFRRIYHLACYLF